MSRVELDHAGIAVRNLTPLLEYFSALGFAPTEPQPLLALDPESGERIDLGQLSAHVMFEDNYLELTEVPDAQSGNHLEPFLQRYEGLHILIFRSDDLEALRKRAEGLGYAPSAIQHASRDIHYGVRGAAHFEWFMLSRTDTPMGLVGFVHHRTRDLTHPPCARRGKRSRGLRLVWAER